MANFQAAHRIVMVHEGGYVNDPQDSGGETYAGISRNNFPKWDGWPIIDTIKRTTTVPAAINGIAGVNPGLQNSVLSFYKANFWDKLLLDQVQCQEIAVELYDTAVNMGLGKSGMFLQRSLNASASAGLVVDGQVGPKTISVLNASQQQDNVLKVLNCLQGASYVAMIEANPAKAKYFKSWFSRVSL